MYTYKLGGMLITDELYHDDLEAVTFGRKDQNELMHYGIKGQSWGKRRFQNEDGSLTMAGRNRYDVGDSRQAPSPHTDYKSGVRNGVAAPARSSGSYGSSMTGKGTKAQPVKAAGVSQQTRNDIAARTAANRQRISNTANTGRKAADSLFGRIGNWATNVYNDASKAVTGAANAAGNWVGDKAKDVGNAVTSTVANLSNTPEFRDAAEAFNNTKHLVTGAANAAGNWATNAYNDASKAVTGAANDAGNYVKNAAQDVSDWFTGDKAGREAQRYDNVVQNFERNGDRNINEGIDTISKAINIKDKYPNVSEANFDKGIKQRNLGYDQHEIASQYGQKADEAQARYDAAPRQLLNAAGNWIGDKANDIGKTVSGAANSAGNAIGNAARDVGDWASNAASDVRDWGAGALDKGRQAFENLFGRSEPPVPTLSDPNSQIETETILRENIIPEQRISEQRVPEQRITEQRIPEQRITENRIEEQRMAEKQDPGGFNSRPLTKEENEIELKRVNDRLNNIDNYYDHLRANNNPQWSNYTKQDIIDLLTKDRDRYQNKINQQQEAERARALSDKPDGVSDEYWREYTFNGGTRDSYDREMNARKNSAVPLSSDKDYAAEQKRLRNIAAQQDRNGFRVEEVNAPVGTVDTSRPHHFTYDPASGQTIVVYDDEKRR